MRVLIVGCGYLGLRLGLDLHRAGVTVAAVTRSPVRAEEFRMRGFEPIVADVILRPDELELPAADATVYAVGFDAYQGKSITEVYPTGLANTLAKLPGDGKLIYVSSTGVYGQDDGEEVDEESPTEPGDDGGRAVLAAEHVLRSQRPDAIILRFAGLYGPGRLLRRKSLEAGEPVPGDPDGWLNLVHVEDGVKAVRAAIDRGVSGATYNVVDDRPAKRKEFFTTLARSLKAPVPTFSKAASTRTVNRRVGNAKLHNELGVKLQYPSFVEGLAASRRSSL